MSMSDFNSREKHTATITAATDVVLAILAFGELKMEVRKSPQEVSLTPINLKTSLQSNNRSL